MICPYNVKLHTTEYSEKNENQLPTGTTVTNEYFKYMECVCENCGAFYKGRCRYNGN